MSVDCCSLTIVCYWSVVVGCWCLMWFAVRWLSLLIVCCSLLGVCCWCRLVLAGVRRLSALRVVVCCVLLLFGWSCVLFGVCCSLLLLVVRWLMLAVGCCLLFAGAVAVCCRLVAVISECCSLLFVELC